MNNYRLIQPLDNGCALHRHFGVIRGHSEVIKSVNIHCVRHNNVKHVP